MLSFLGDTSQLDQVFARIPAQAAESMARLTTACHRSTTRIF